MEKKKEALSMDIAKDEVPEIEEENIPAKKSFLKRLTDGFKNFAFGKVCPKFKEGRLGKMNDDGTVECFKCHHKEKE